jgi:hypothetical protein
MVDCLDIIFKTGAELLRFHRVTLPECVDFYMYLQHDTFLTPGRQE